MAQCGGRSVDFQQCERHLPTCCRLQGQSKRDCGPALYALCIRAIFTRAPFTTHIGWGLLQAKARQRAGGARLWLFTQAVLFRVMTAPRVDQVFQLVVFLIAFH